MAKAFAVIWFGLFCVLSLYAEPGYICEAYAGEAVTQQEANRTLQCGFTGPAWNLSYNYHYLWCKSAPSGAANSESISRATGITECKKGKESKTSATANKDADKMLENECHYGKFNNLGQLARQSKNLNVPHYSTKYTPLMWVSVRGKAQHARELVAAGAKLDVQNSDGYTALMLAVAFKNYDVMRELVNLKANTRIKNNSGNSAIDSAEKTSDIKALDILNASK